MIRKWEVFSNFSCSPEIISLLHTLRILIAFPWHLCTDLLRKALSISERCSSAWTWANTVAEWHWIWKWEIPIYTLHLLPQGSSHTHWAHPKVMHSADFHPYPNPTLLDLQLFNSVSTTPPSPQVLLELLFTHRLHWVGVQFSKALCSPSQWSVPVVRVASVQ